jgi:hypothetical protein
VDTPFLPVLCINCAFGAFSAQEIVRIVRLFLQSICEIATIEMSVSLGISEVLDAHPSRSWNSGVCLPCVLAGGLLVEQWRPSDL